MTNDILGSFTGITIGTLTLSKIIPAIIIFIICYIVVRLVSKLTDKLLLNAKKLDGTLQGFIRSAVKIILWTITAIIVADALGIPTTSLVALVSVAGLALSLSIQNIMSNLFSGITLLVTKPFTAGDHVEIAGKSGLIKTVGLFYTVMDSFDNMVISIPNSDVTASAVVNYSTEPLRRVDMKFSASYDDPTGQVRDAILSAAAGDERIVEEPAPFVAISEYKASSIEYIVRLWCKNSDYWSVYYGMNERVRQSFEENGVHMSYEHINVHLMENEE